MRKIMTTQQLTNNQESLINNQANNSTVTTKPYRVDSSNTGSLRRITSYDQIRSPHHGGRAYTQQKINGRNQATRNDGGGVTRVVQDMVLSQDGKYNVNVPSGVEGYVTMKKDFGKGGKGYGNYAEIKNKEGKVIARYAHLESTANIKDGQFLTRGTILGVQGKSGTNGLHLHVEMEDKEYARYIADLQSGKFSNNENSSQATSSEKAVSDNNVSTESSSQAANSSSDESTDVRKVAAMLQKNSGAVIQQYGIDPNTEEGLGKAIMMYWRENNLDPGVLREQLPEISNSDIQSAFNQARTASTGKSGSDNQLTA
jgi:Peptidase family M23